MISFKKPVYLGMYSEKTVIQKDTRTPIIRAALFIIAEIQKQPRHLLIDKWLEKLWHMYTMEHYSAIRRSELSLSQLN